MNKDKTLTCRDCGNTFEFTASEQDFYAEKGFSNEPTRCQSCRAARKGSGGSSGGRSFGGGSPSREMYPATCASCDKSTQVPFKPVAGRPVYCSDCFSRQR